MKSIGIFSALSVLALTSFTDATCFTTGLDGDRSEAHNRVTRMCDFLAGDYAIRQAKHHAFTYFDGVYPRRWDFWITNARDVTAFNSHEGCVEFLEREINCLKGGETYYPTLGWIFQ